MQGIFGGYDSKGIGILDGDVIPFAQQYRKSQWKSDICSLGVLDLESNSNSIAEDSDWSIAFFGEAFGLVNDKTNSMEKWHVSTAEELQELIRSCGESAVESLNGAFVAALFDKNSNELRIVNDRFGIYPLYYTVNDDGGFYFSQDVMFLNQIRELEPDYAGIAEYLSFDYCLEDRTVFKDVKYILPAQRITINKSGLNLNTYWELPVCDGKKTKKKKEYLQELHSLYEEAVLDRKNTGANILGLSGGFDSRLILAILENGREVYTFNYGNDGSGDVVGAKALADVYNTNHRHYKFDAIDYNSLAREITLRTAGQSHHDEFYQLYLGKEKSKICSGVELAGIGGDAISGQKSNFTGLCPIMGASMTESRKKYNRKRLINDITRGRNSVGKSGFYGPFIRTYWKEVLNDYDRALKAAEKGPTFGNYIMRLKARSLERRTTIPAMAITGQFMPVRLPVYDYRVMNFFNYVPQTYRFGQRLYIRLIQDYYPKAAACPHSETGRAVRESHCVMTDFVTVKNYIRKRMGLNNTNYTNIYGFVEEALLKDENIRDLINKQDETGDGLFDISKYGTTDNILAAARAGNMEAYKLLKDIIQISLLNDLYFKGHISMYYKAESH